MNGGFSMRLVRVRTAVVIVAIAFEACEATTESRAAEAIPIQEVRGCSSKPMGGFQGGAEVIFFKPFAEAGSTPNSILASSGADEFLPAWRLWGGYANDEGLGSRIRWWQYDQAATSTPPSPESAFPSRLIFQKLDGEVTQQVCFHSWELLVSGGLTYVGNEINSLHPDQRFDERYRFDGVGLTAGLQAIRDGVLFPSMKMVGTMQWSGVYGNSTSSSLFVPQPPPAPPSNDHAFSSTTASVLELSIGPRWERTLDGGAILFAGGAAEAQYWTTGLGTLFSLLPIGAGGGDVGLVGLSVNVGLRR